MSDGNGSDRETMRRAAIDLYARHRTDRDTHAALRQRFGEATPTRRTVSRWLEAAAKAGELTVPRGAPPDPARPPEWLETEGRVQGWEPPEEPDTEGGSVVPFEPAGAGDALPGGEPGDFDDDDDGLAGLASLAARRLRETLEDSGTLDRDAIGAAREAIRWADALDRRRVRRSAPQDEDDTAFKARVSGLIEDIRRDFEALGLPCNVASAVIADAGDPWADGARGVPTPLETLDECVRAAVRKASTVARDSAADPEDRSKAGRLLGAWLALLVAVDPGDLSVSVSAGPPQ